MIVHARAPLRLGIAGGGSDVSPYSDQFGGLVVNATIDKYAYVELREHPDGKITFSSTDFGFSETDSVESAFSKNSGMPLHSAVYRKIVDEFNGGKPIPLEITTYSDAPVGSGLGASSTLVVAMIKAFDSYLELSLSKQQIAEMAYKIERLDCGLAGGRQDQFSAAFGGFNYLEFDSRGSKVTPINISSDVIKELESSLLLYYTGVSRSSATIIAEQSQNLVSSNETAIEAMHIVKSEASSMRQYLESGNLLGIVQSMKKGWEFKKATSAAVSSQLIDETYVSAIDAGALAGKVSGAGGGGFMWFYVPINSRAAVISALSKFDGIVGNCHFTNEGATAWKVN